MLSHRLYFVAILSTLFLSGALLLIAPFEPAHAQCDPGIDCEEVILPTATPVRTDCPPGSHPIGSRDCEVDGTGGRATLSLSASVGGAISGLVDFNYDGSTLTVNGSLQDINGVIFDHQTAHPDAEICNGDSANDNTNYQAYSIVNATNQVHTVAIELTKDTGNLDPFLHVYLGSFDPANPADNCLKAAEGDGTTALIRRFTWKPGLQLVVVATGLDTSSDEGNFTLTIMPAGSEQEPNDDIENARPISPNIDWVTAEISPTGDIDYYRFEAVNGQRVWIYVRTDQSTTSQDSFFELRNGLDVNVASGVDSSSDDNNGGQSDDSSAIAGFEFGQTRSYYVRVTEATSSTTIAPYYLYVYLSDQNPIPESEPNNFITTTTIIYDNDGGPTYQLPPLIFQGFQGSAFNGDDFFQFTLPFSSVVYTSLDTDPDNDSKDFDGTLSLYDSAGVTPVVSVDSGNTIPRSEALSYGQTASETLTTTTWYASVISDTTGPSLQYRLLAGYSPTEQGDVTYSTDVVDKFIFPDESTITSTLVSGNFCMDNLDVWLDLDHDNLDDLDVSLQAPDGTTVELFADRGGDDNSLSITLDDEGGLAPLPDDGVDANNARIGGRYKTDDLTLHELYRKSGIGEWILTITDDTGGNNNEPGNADKLNNWALIMHCGIKEFYMPIILKDS